MSLDVYLHSDVSSPSSERWAIYVRENGATVEVDEDEWRRRYPDREPIRCKVEGNSTVIYHANITHNLTDMAAKAQLYDCLWRPDEHGLETAIDLIPKLAMGLDRLLRKPERYKRLNPSNGWGDYDGLVKFVSNYLKACIDHPTALIEVSR